MRRFALALALGATLAAAPSLQARDRLSGEERLAKLLEGRVAGAPVDCIYLPRVRDARIIDRTAIVYDAGSTIWVNRPASGARQLDDDDVMVTRPTSSQLCKVDVVHLRDRSNLSWNGFVGLGQFVPYTRTRSARAN